jgi:hypothetical protein
MGGVEDIMSSPDETGRRWVNHKKLEILMPRKYKKSFADQIRNADKITLQRMAGLVSDALVRARDTNQIAANELDTMAKIDAREFNERIVMMNSYANGKTPILDTSYTADFIRNMLNSNPIKLSDKEFGLLLKEHIERINAVLEIFFGHVQKEIQKIVNNTSRLPRDEDGYSEVVVNNYKVLGVAFFGYHEKLSGQKLVDRLNLEKQTKLLNLPFWDFDLYREDNPKRYTVDYEQYSKRSIS